MYHIVVLPITFLSSFLNIQESSTTISCRTVYLTDKQCFTIRTNLCCVWSNHHLLFSDCISFYLMHYGRQWTWFASLGWYTVYNIVNECLDNIMVWLNIFLSGCTFLSLWYIFCLIARVLVSQWIYTSVWLEVGLLLLSF